MLAASPIGPASGGKSLDRAGIRLSYWWRHGRLPNLDDPRLFTEWIQYRKLHDRDPRMPILADKVAVKAWVAARLGADWVIPTLWHGAMLPSAAVWPTPFVVKARHGCNQSRFVFDDAAAWLAVRRDAARWMRKRYGGWLSEWLYHDIPRGLLVEPFVGVDATLPVDYKFFVFAGRVEYVQVHLGRGARHRWIVFDREWRRLSRRTEDPDPARPNALVRMMAAAETLGQGFTFVRVDLYDGANGPLFGEMTFYPGSGLDRCDPVSLDTRMGRDWQLALEHPAARAAA
ncbi:ATP-grasp fold amidoligase family protein [Sphingomonas sp. BAUL-RG-20F-R05-02]|uniref:ATP-grasp fold amidoligase family protein n=1 Tax=Sphingomonas sp. BAUL-RG-20F-R05-02 TaxID=2914830 RepID=UPI00241287E6|nr:ATP-grasp fold amidoligase family protein [Sphingomonas sp. BAUL-RG-20F-R05-02]